jgi:hypothetical protein
LDMTLLALRSGLSAPFCTRDVARSISRDEPTRVRKKKKARADGNEKEKNARGTLNDRDRPFGGRRRV